ncbi:hypothetical protein PoHVEF18_010515 [Penicillium ochrochloron]
MARRKAPRTRATHANPIKPKHFWCMHYLQTSVKSYKPELDIPFKIECVLDAKASIAYR